MALVNQLLWRYATKKFNPEKAVSEEEITILLRGMNLAPSSLGMQPYKIIVVRNDELQLRLQMHSFNQPQIVNASHVIVLAAKKDVTESDANDYIEQTAKTRKLSIKSLQSYKDMIMAYLNSKNPEEIQLWTQKQCYLVLGVLISLCADMHIDACPIEGFVPEKYNEILGLNELGLNATVVIPVGYRLEDDLSQAFEKSRKELDDLVSLRYSE